MNGEGYTKFVLLEFNTAFTFNFFYLTSSTKTANFDNFFFKKSVQLCYILCKCFILKNSKIFSGTSDFEALCDYDDVNDNGQTGPRPLRHS